MESIVRQIRDLLLTRRIRYLFIAVFFKFIFIHFFFISAVVIFGAMCWFEDKHIKPLKDILNDELVVKRLTEHKMQL